MALAKATLQPLMPDLDKPDTSAADKKVTVQFNPDTLKISLSNSIATPDGGGDQRGSAPLQFVGAGSSKLTCTLWFDVTSMPVPAATGDSTPADDVRKLTTAVAYYMTAKQDPKDKKKFISPAVAFSWGSLIFKGIMDSYEESLEFFSPEGKPLRASVAISISQQKIVIFPPQPIPGSPSATPPGTTPTTPVPQGSSVQQMAGPGWQGVASANGIENPRLPQAGLRLDLNPLN
jgi:Contractile injection system tube protein